MRKAVIIKLIYCWFMYFVCFFFWKTGMLPQVEGNLLNSIAWAPSSLARHPHTPILWECLVAPILPSFFIFFSLAERSSLTCCMEVAKVKEDASLLHCCSQPSLTLNKSLSSHCLWNAPYLCWFPQFACVCPSLYSALVFRSLFLKKTS